MVETSTYTVLMQMVVKMLVLIHRGGVVGETSRETDQGSTPLSLVCTRSYRDYTLLMAAEGAMTVFRIRFRKVIVILK